MRVTDKMQVVVDTDATPEPKQVSNTSAATDLDGSESARPSSHLTQGGTPPRGAMPPPPPDPSAGRTADPVAASRSSTDLGARVELATALTVAGGSGTEVDRTLGIAELSKLPLSLLQLLDAQGVELVMCRDSVTDYVTQLQGVTPPGWPPGFTWDDVPAAYLSDVGRVVVATRVVNGRRAVPPTKAGHNSFNVLLHEAGHAADLASGASLAPEFVDAYAADFAALPTYLQQAGEAGHQEAFAEVFARYFGGDATLQDNLPNLAAFFDSQLAGR